MAANFWGSSQAAAISVCSSLEEHHVDSQKGREEEGLSEWQLDQITFFHISYIQELVAIASKTGVRHRVAATASVFFRRVFLRRDFSEVDPRCAAPATVYLAAKAEETHLPMKVLFHSMARLSTKFPAVPLLDVKMLADLEMLVMEKLNFWLLVWHPEPDLHALLSSPHCTGLAHHAWSIMNDSYQTRVLLLHPPHIVALSCIAIAAVFHDKDIQEWLGSFNADLDEVNEAVDMITRVYENVPRASSSDINQMMARLQITSESGSH